MDDDRKTESLTTMSSFVVEFHCFGFQILFALLPFFRAISGQILRWLFKVSLNLGPSFCEQICIYLYRQIECAIDGQ